ncbi:MAG: hypothetical protein O7D91_21455 [Planctomycetota bacterium]|nr:hypothetical protein [Planctomycetota bacterium]
MAALIKVRQGKTGWEVLATVDGYTTVLVTRETELEAQNTRGVVETALT